MRSQPLLALSVICNEPASSAVTEIAAALMGSRLPATWIVGEGHLAAGKLLCGQELGLSVPAGLLAAERARSVVVDALVRARQRAARLGGACTTLLADHARTARHADLLAKYGIQCLTDDASQGDSARAANARSLRYGLWHIPVALAWPWSSSRGWFRSAMLERAVRQAAGSGGLLHVRFDVAAIEQGGRAGRTQLAHDIEQLAGTARQHGLATATLAGAAERLSCPRPRVAPARSILRVA